jgi:hypothetical protein
MERLSVVVVQTDQLAAVEAPGHVAYRNVFNFSLQIVEKTPTKKPLFIQ